MASTTVPDPNDPGKLLSKTVKVQGTSREELNGTLGTVVSYMPQQDRYIIQLQPPPPPTDGSGPRSQPPRRTVSLKQTNLAPASYTERTRFTVEEMKRAATTLYHDPQTRASLHRAYDHAQRRLPDRVKPEHAAGLLLLLLFVVVRTFGFHRTFFLFSILGLLGSVALPDVYSGAGAKATALNFPRRWRDTLVEASGFGWITQRMATGALVALLLLSGKVLVGSSGGGSGGGKRTNVPPVAPASPGYASPSTDDDGGAVGKWTVEDVYKLGFDDAARAEEYGRSLPADHNALGYFASRSGVGTTPLSIPSDDVYLSMDDYDTPSAQKKGGFGIGTAVSLFAIGRTVKELGFVGGRFDPALLVANVKSMETWKLGFMGLAVYRVVSTFL